MAADASNAGTVARVRDSGPGSLKATISVAGQTFAGDEPVSAGGTGTGPAPHDLLSAGLAECTALTLRLYADRKAWPLEGIEVDVTHEVRADATPRDLFRRAIRLLEIADRCPVHRTLVAGSRIETSPSA